MSHLVGTMDLLRGGGYSDNVCNAGLLHSIYGTNRFTLMSLDPRAPGARDRVYVSFRWRDASTHAHRVPQRIDHVL